MGERSRYPGVQKPPPPFQQRRSKKEVLEGGHMWASVMDEATARDSEVLGRGRERNVLE